MATSLSFGAPGATPAPIRAPTATTAEDEALKLDFATQGEYAGEVTTAAGPVKYGVQVIARGGGAFDAAGYFGGLPGDGGTKSEHPIPLPGKRAGDKVVFPSFKTPTITGSLEIQGGALRILDAAGAEIGKLPHVHRKSPTEGEKPPKGAVVLFDGKSGEAFGNAKVTKDGLLNVQENRGLTSTRKFGSCKVHLEFQLPFEPGEGGQGRGNSGCYLQGRYEVQVLDSFGLIDFKEGDCGGIYNTRPPTWNLCYPPGSWQTYDIEFTPPVFGPDGKKSRNAALTVRHNGVLIHTRTEPQRETTAAPIQEGPGPGPIYLQDHGHPVLYRNIWVVEAQ